MAQRTTVRLPEDLVARAKRKGLAEGRSLTALIEDGLRRVLDDRRPRHRDERTLPPVSSATGGLMAGVDLDNTAALQDMEDQEAAGRRR
jgi:hypothetical protein